MRSEEFIQKKSIIEDGEVSPIGSIVTKKKKPIIDAKKKVEELAKQIKSVK